MVTLLPSGAEILRVPDDSFGLHVMVLRPQLAAALGARLEDITLHEEARLMTGAPWMGRWRRLYLDATVLSRIVMLEPWMHGMC